MVLVKLLQLLLSLRGFPTYQAVFWVGLSCWAWVPIIMMILFFLIEIMMMFFFGDSSISSCKASTTSLSSSSDQSRIGFITCCILISSFQDFFFFFLMSKSNLLKPKKTQGRPTRKGPSKGNKENKKTHHPSPTPQPSQKIN